MIKDNINTINKILEGNNQINRAYLNGSVVFGSVPMPLEVFTSALTFTYRASSQEFKVKGENWTVTKTGEWFSISPVSGDGTGYITVTAQENTVIDTPRSGSITISSNGVSETVSLTQDGARETSLPDVDYFFNINAKEYDETSLNFQPGNYNIYNANYLVESDIGGGYYDSMGLFFDVTRGGEPVKNGDYITVPLYSYINLKYSSTSNNPFNIANGKELTFIIKQKTTELAGDGSYIGNRSDTTYDGHSVYGGYNYMLRQKANINTFHLYGEGYGDVPGASGNTLIISFTVRAENGNATITGHNWTSGVEGLTNSGSFNSGSSRFGIFTGNYPEDEWGGDFYWLYVAPTILTDEEIQQVIDFNEN